MNKEQSFIVDSSKNTKKETDNNQRLFCSCGAKHKIKSKIRRILTRTTESDYEDKYDFDKISCKTCGSIFDLLKNPITLRPGKTVLLKISFEKENVDLGHKTLHFLYKKRHHYVFNQERDQVEEVIVRESLIYDSKTKKVDFFCSNTNYNLSEDVSVLYNDYSSAFLPSNSKSNLEKTTYLNFDLCNKEFLKMFFHFSSSIRYQDIEVCFSFFYDILSLSLDSDFLKSQPFFQEFTISSRIFTENKDGIENNFVLSKNPFGVDGTIKRKLDVGDYLYKLKKMGHIVFIFVSFPPISSLAKIKGLDFVFNSYINGFYPSIKRLYIDMATKPHRIIETCCANHYDKLTISRISKIDKNTQEFKFSTNLLKKIRDYEDALVISKFYLKSELEKNELDSLFLKYDFDDVIKLMSMIITTSNFRDIKMSFKHYNHILKNKILDETSNEWLVIYYDTINTLRLIINVIEQNKEKSINKKRFKQLSKFSETKIFETRSFLKLKELHDEMFVIYRALEDDEKDVLYRSFVKNYRNLNQEEDFFKFTVIPNLKELSHEGLIMKHCIYTYLQDIVKGEYLAIRVKDTISKELGTLGIKIINQRLYLQQLKGYENSRTTSLMINSVISFCDRNGILIRKDYMHSSDFQPNEMLEKRMKNYKDKGKSLIIRQKGMEKK